MRSTSGDVAPHPTRPAQEQPITKALVHRMQACKVEVSVVRKDAGMQSRSFSGA
jgi:hypothetical protein